jgi:hypothetical protein
MVVRVNPRGLAGALVSSLGAGDPLPLLQRPGARHPHPRGAVPSCRNRIGCHGRRCAWVAALSRRLFLRRLAAACFRLHLFERMGR